MYGLGLQMNMAGARMSYGRMATCLKYLNFMVSYGFYLLKIGPMMNRRGQGRRHWHRKWFSILTALKKGFRSSNLFSTTRLNRFELFCAILSVGFGLRPRSRSLVPQRNRPQKPIISPKVVKGEEQTRS